jgi:hypothetical protein
VDVKQVFKVFGIARHSIWVCPEGVGVYLETSRMGTGNKVR